MAAWIFLRTSSLVTWSLYEMFIRIITQASRFEKSGSQKIDIILLLLNKFSLHVAFFITLTNSGKEIIQNFLIIFYMKSCQINYMLKMYIIFEVLRLVSAIFGTASVVQTINKFPIYEHLDPIVKGIQMNCLL